MKFDHLISISNQWNSKPCREKHVCHRCSRIEFPIQSSARRSVQQWKEIDWHFVSNQSMMDTEDVFDRLLQGKLLSLRTKNNPTCTCRDILEEDFDLYWSRWRLASYFLRLFTALIRFFFSFSPSGVFEAPLASDDEDSQSDKDSLIDESNVLLIRQLFHSNENEPMDSLISSRPRSSRLKKASAIVVPSSTFNIIGNHIEARIVRIRLVFIHIGERQSLRWFRTDFTSFRRDRHVEREVSSGYLLWSALERATHQFDHTESDSSTANATLRRESLGEVEWIQFEQCLVTSAAHRECHRTDRCTR